MRALERVLDTSHPLCRDSKQDEQFRTECRGRNASSSEVCNFQDASFKINFGVSQLLAVVFVAPTGDQLCKLD